MNKARIHNSDYILNTRKHRATIITRHAVEHVHVVAKVAGWRSRLGDFEGDVLGGAGFGDAVYDDDLEEVASGGHGVEGDVGGVGEAG